MADLQAAIREAFRAGIDSASTGPGPITADTEGGRIFLEAFRDGLRADTTNQGWWEIATVPTCARWE